MTSTPQHTHTVLAYRRPWAQTGDQLERLATRVLPLPEGRLAQIRTVRRRIRSCAPTSSTPTRPTPACTCGCLPGPPGRHRCTRRTPIRSSVATCRRRARPVLAGRGGSASAAAAWPRSAREVRAGCPPTGPAGGRPAAERGARPAATASRCPRPTPPQGGLRLAMLGRISPQKGPEFFRRAVQLSRALARRRSGSGWVAAPQARRLPSARPARS